MFSPSSNSEWSTVDDVESLQFLESLEFLKIEEGERGIICDFSTSLYDLTPSMRSVDKFAMVCIKIDSRDC